MPNHVYCSISSTSRKGDKVMETLQPSIEKIGLCELLLPIPQELEGTTSPFPKKRIEIREVEGLMDAIEANKQVDEDSNRMFPTSKVEFDGVMYFFYDNWLTFDEPCVERYYTQEEVDEDNKKDKSKELHPRKLFSKEDQERFIERYGFDNWYDWRIANYGTKWGDYDNEVEDGNVRFTSAWSPINDAMLDRLSIILPDFVFTYEEEQGWGGEIEYKNGERVEEHSFDIPSWEEVEDEDEITFLSEDHTQFGETYVRGYYNYYSLYDFLGETLEEAKRA